MRLLVTTFCLCRRTIFLTLTSAFSIFNFMVITTRPQSIFIYALAICSARRGSINSFYLTEIDFPTCKFKNENVCSVIFVQKVYAWNKWTRDANLHWLQTSNNIKLTKMTLICDPPGLTIAPLKSLRFIFYFFQKRKEKRTWWMIT